MITCGTGTSPTHCEKGILIAKEPHLQKYPHTTLWLSRCFWAFPMDPMDSRSRCSTENAQQQQQNVECSPWIPPTLIPSLWQCKGRQDICSSTGVFPSVAVDSSLPPLWNLVNTGMGVLGRVGGCGRRCSVNPPGPVVQDQHFPPLHPVSFLPSRPKPALCLLEHAPGSCTALF